jgi:uncharacterized protein
MQPSDDLILKRFRAALDEMYGGGWSASCCSALARGDAGEDTDYDVAVFLNDLREGDLADRWRELDRLADLCSEILSVPRPSSTLSRIPSARIGTRRR